MIYNKTNGKRKPSMISHTHKQSRCKWALQRLHGMWRAPSASAHILFPDLTSAGLLRMQHGLPKRKNDSECITVVFHPQRKTSKKPLRSCPAWFVCTHTSWVTFANEIAGNKCHVLIYLETCPAEVRAFFCCLRTTRAGEQRSWWDSVSSVDITAGQRCQNCSHSVLLQKYE